MVDAQTKPQAPPISFPGKDPTEEFRFYFHQHRIRVVQAGSRVFLLFLACIAGIYFSGVFTTEDDMTRRMVAVLLSVFFFVPQMNFLIRIYRHFLYLIVVTDKKVHTFKRTLISVDRHESVDLSALQDIKKHQRGIVQNMLGFGTLTLEAQNSKLTLHFTPDIDTIYNSILGLRELARHTQPNNEPPLPVA